MFYMLKPGYLDSYYGVFDLPPSCLDCDLLIILLTAFFSYAVCSFQTV